MKIYLASILEPENFGKGRVIGIANGNKPFHIDVDFKFTHFIPSDDLMKRYNKMSPDNQDAASDMFVKEFSEQLEEFVGKVNNTAEEKGVTPMELLPFQDSDTLVSWQRSKYTHYRDMIAPVLEKFGYEVISN